jgi:hypothetical protein
MGLSGTKAKCSGAVGEVATGGGGVAWSQVAVRTWWQLPCRSEIDDDAWKPGCELGWQGALLQLHLHVLSSTADSRTKSDEEGELADVSCMPCLLNPAKAVGFLIRC